MRPRAQFPDIEAHAIDTLDDLLAAEDCTVGVLPDSWRTPDEPDLPTTPHVQVAWDGTDNVDQIIAFATIRITAWAPQGRPDEAKRLALLAEGLLMELPDVRPGIGITPARDPQTRAEVATFTARWSWRSIPIPQP